MKSYSLGFVALFSSAVFLSSCTEPGETTYIGAATGGVLGAGLGAIVGNQTGDPGAGLVIGSVAGAGAGAAIGNSLEAQQKSIRTQDEAIERQQKMLAAQNAEIRELRNMPNDTQSAVGAAFSSEARGSLSNRRDLNSESSNSDSITDSLNRGSDAQKQNSKTFRSPQPRVNSYNETVRQPPAAAFSDSSNRSGTSAVARSFSSPSIQEKNLETKPIIENENTFKSNRDPAETLKQNDLLESELEVASSDTELVVAKRAEAKSSNLSAECESAGSEEAKAQSAKEPADRLFYLRRAIRLCPTNAGYHKSLADEYVELGRNEDAKASYQDALKLDPSLSDVKKSMAAISSNTY